MEKTKVEELFAWIDRTTEIIQTAQNAPYLDCLTETLECLYEQDVSESIDVILGSKIKQALAEIQLDTFTTDDRLKAVSFAILKGMKDSTQQQHLETPETIALLMGYIAEKLTKKLESIRVFDPACGTSNLLLRVLGQLKNNTIAYGSEIDPTLLKLSLMRSNLQQSQIEFFHQDSLRPFLLDPVDLVIADLPVGYYPDDVRANAYTLHAEQGHSFAHHLFIEQCINYTKNGGYVMVVVPNFIFDGEAADKLHTYMQTNAHIVGVLQLPESAFKSAKNAKSILILQKKGEHTTTFKQPLFVQLPSFKNKKAMNDILDQMNGWFQTNFK